AEAYRCTGIPPHRGTYSCLLQRTRDPSNEYVPPSGHVAMCAPSDSSAAKVATSPGWLTNHTWISRSTLWRLVLQAKARLLSIAAMPRCVSLVVDCMRK